MTTERENTLRRRAGCTYRPGCPCQACCMAADEADEAEQAPQHPIAKWYADQAAEAERTAELLRQARAAGAPAKEIRRLEYQLELARYVGD